MWLLQLIFATKLHKRFPAHEMLNALSVIYPQYWIGGDCEIEFALHLNTLKAAYAVPKVAGKECRVVAGPLNGHTLDL